MPGVWDFGGAYAGTAGELQRQDLEQQRMGIEQQRFGMAKQEFPLQLEHLKATTRLDQANASLAEFNLKAKQDLARLSEGMTLGDPNESQSTRIMRFAETAMKAGDSTLANNLIMRAGQAQLYESRIEAEQARKAKAESDQKIKMADRWGGLMGGVNSPEDLARAKMIFQSEFGEPAPDIPYDPGTIKLMQEATKKYSDKIREDHNKVMEELQSRRLAAENGYHGAMISLRRAELDRKKELDRTKGKESGKDVGAPQKGEIDAATNLIKREGKDKGLDAETSQSAAFDLASRARALRRANPGLDAGEAMQRALVEQVSEGYYTTKTTKGFLGFGKKTTTQYGKPGASADKPLDPPKDLKQLQKGSYYKTPKGVMLYIGDGKLQHVAPSGGDGAADEEDDPAELE